MIKLRKKTMNLKEAVGYLTKNIPQGTLNYWGSLTKTGRKIFIDRLVKSVNVMQKENQKINVAARGIIK